jgi:hypothetical protein
MSLDVQSTTPSEPKAYGGLGFRADWGENVVTALAVGTGVLVVALVAVLMGLA